MLHKLSSYIRSNSVSIGLVVIFLAFVSILCLQAVATERIREQVITQKQIIFEIKNVTNRINASSSSSKEQISELNDHIDCIVYAFTDKGKSSQIYDRIRDCSKK